MLHKNLNEFHPNKIRQSNLKKRIPTTYIARNGLLTNRCLHRAEVGGPLCLKPACSGTKDEGRQAAPAPLVLQSGLIWISNTLAHLKPLTLNYNPKLLEAAPK